MHARIGPEIRYEQMQQLASVARRKETTLQVVPFAAGAHPGSRGAFF
jgi:hypothetical protein